MSTTPKPARPLGVTISAVIAFVGGIFGLLGGAMVLTNSTPEPVWLGYIVIIFAILGLALGYGFFKRPSWAWMTGLIVYILSIPLGLYEITLGGAGTIGGAIRVVVGLIIIYYLMQSQVKVFFGRSG
jgi:hypothetical protein